MDDQNLLSLQTNFQSAEDRRLWRWLAFPILLLKEFVLFSSCHFRSILEGSR